MKIREKLVTRTVTTLSVTVIGFDSDDSPAVKVFEIPEIEDRKILPYITDISGDTFTPAKVKNVEKRETLYGMPESVFIANAEKLPPRTINAKEQG